MAQPLNKTMHLVKFCIVLIAIATYFYCPQLQDFIFRGTSYLKHHDFEGLRQFILSYGYWAPLTSIALMVLQSLIPFLPGLIITLTNAWIFGWQYGSLYSWIGALLGAALDFSIARWYGRPLVEHIINSKYLDITDKFFSKHGVLAVFITRLIPIIPFKVISYGAGITLISLGQFLTATGLGQIPAIVLYSILGQQLNHHTYTAIAITFLLSIAGIVIYCYRDLIERHFFSNRK